VRAGLRRAVAQCLRQRSASHAARVVTRLCPRAPFSGFNSASSVELARGGLRQFSPLAQAEQVGQPRVGDRVEQRVQRAPEIAASASAG
jgi:hypothetical protein